LLSKLNFKNYILWIGTPSAAFLLDIFDPTLLIYNPVDRYYAFPFVNSVKTRNYERQIAANSDVIICTAEAIRKDLLPYNEYSFTVTHGVDFNHFHSALSGSNVPEDIKDIPKPIIGYFGGLSDRVNYRLLSKIEIRYPNASIVLIGKKLQDLGKLEKLPNVHILGYRDLSVLPHYLKQFSVCLIPYHVNELMEGVDPIKLREYLCLGKAVVSVDLPEVRKLEGLVYIGKNEEDYIVKVGKAMEENSASLIEERIRAAKQSDWPVKIEQISNIVFDAFDRKRFSKNNHAQEAWF
jgi:glycosyltransferase involved in cell wall biosynthesis